MDRLISAGVGGGGTSYRGLFLCYQSREGLIGGLYNRRAREPRRVGASPMVGERVFQKTDDKEHLQGNFNSF